MKQAATDYFFSKLEKKPDAALRMNVPMAFNEEAVQHVHFVGICGKAMATLAGLFIKAGYTVSGSDDQWNPPMSTMLEHIGIKGAAFNPENVVGADLVVMGNAFGPSNIEATAARENHIPQISSAEAYATFFIRDSRSIVIAGTHGKTTTSGLAAHVFSGSGKSTTALVGGVLKNFGESYIYGGTHPKYSVVEGDEYDTAYFDKGPKFLHYRPTIGVITSLEFDHADIYDDMEDYLAAFVFFAGEIPKNGYLLLSESVSMEYAKKIRDACSGEVSLYGQGEGCDIRASNIRIDRERGGQLFDLTLHGEVHKDFFIPLFGSYNVDNALTVASIALLEQIEETVVKELLAVFQGTEQRQQTLYDKNGILVIDDFAHHPTAVRVTLEGIRDHYPNQRIIAIFEPRTNTSRRKDFETPYGESFDAADIVCFSVPKARHNDTSDNFLDPNRVVSIINDRGSNAQQFLSAESIVEYVVKMKKEGDIIVVMSNGPFDGLRELLVRALDR